MIISLHGGNTVRFQTGDMVIAANPSHAPHGQKSPKFGADIVLCSSFLPEHYSVDSVSHSDGSSFVISGPGSYEYHGFTVLAEQLGKSYNDVRQATTTFLFVMDDIRVCVLGSVVARDQLHPDTSDIFSDIDVLVIPIDSENMGDVNNLISFIDPKMIIPVGFWNYADAGIKSFMADHGISGQAPQEKITTKRRDIESMSKSIQLLAI